MTAPAASRAGRALAAQRKTARFVCSSCGTTFTSLARRDYRHRFCSRQCADRTRQRERRARLKLEPEAGP